MNEKVTRWSKESVLKFRKGEVAVKVVGSFPTGWNPILVIFVQRDLLEEDTWEVEWKYFSNLTLQVKEFIEPPDLPSSIYDTVVVAINETLLSLDFFYDENEGVYLLSGGLKENFPSLCERIHDELVETLKERLGEVLNEVEEEGGTVVGEFPKIKVELRCTPSDKTLDVAEGVFETKRDMSLLIERLGGVQSLSGGSKDVHQRWVTLAAILEDNPEVERFIKVLVDVVKRDGIIEFEFFD